MDLTVMKPEELEAIERRVNAEVASGRISGTVRRLLERTGARYLHTDNGTRLIHEKGLVVRERPVAPVSAPIPPSAVREAVRVAKAAGKRRRRQAKREAELRAIHDRRQAEYEAWKRITPDAPPRPPAPFARGWRGDGEPYVPVEEPTL